MTKGLVIIHVDGLGYDYLQKAVRAGQMPFLRRLIESEGYEALPYRCGIPSTTPFAQAGIIFGDNREIPSFRWWDKESGLLVAFGGHSSFRRVAHKYFRGCEPLTDEDGRIATCYSSTDSIEFGIAYREHRARFPSRPGSLGHVLSAWASNPLHLLDWLRRGIWQIWKSNWEYWNARLRGQPAAKTYVISDMLEEIFLHQLTRFAVVQAMKENVPAIYGAFYAYDETSHAYGPDADYSVRILRQIDETIQRICAKRKPETSEGREYDVLVLSDHGQIETVPFLRKYGKHFGQLVAEWLPTYEVEEFRGKRLTPPEAIDGHIALTYSGGLAHMYFKDISWRMGYAEIENRFPGLVDRIAHAPGIGLVLLRDEDQDVIVSADGTFRFGDSGLLPRVAADFLGRYDKPEIVARQLHKLNSFERSGDLIIFGEYADGMGINFEDQVGGHGSLGGEQLNPFILARREWHLDSSTVTDGSELYPLLKRLRDRWVDSA